MEEKESVFREKSLKRVSSPEELDHYLKVTNPSFWLFLAAVIALLLGVIVWGATGKIEGYVNAGCVLKDGSYECVISEDDYSRITSSTVLKIEDEEFSFSAEGMEYVAAAEEDAYMIKLGQISSDNVFRFTGKADLANGYYAGKVITESISPISFILD